MKHTHQDDLVIKFVTSEFIDYVSVGHYERLIMKFYYLSS